MQLETTHARTVLSLTGTAGSSSILLWLRANIKHSGSNYSHLSVPYSAKIELLLIQGLYFQNS